MTAHRTPEARIAALETQIERIKTRAEHAKVRKDPTLRHMRAAVRQIDKAAGACGDRVVRGELQEARTRIAACLALGMGLEAVPPRGAGRRPRRELADEAPGGGSGRGTGNSTARVCTWRSRFTPVPSEQCEAAVAVSGGDGR